MDTDLNATRQPQIIGVACMLLFLSTAAVVLRLLFRWKLSLGLWYDDYTIILALVFPPEENLGQKKASNFGIPL